MPMHTLAFIEGLSPLHLLILLFILALPVGLVFLILWIVKHSNTPNTPGQHIIPVPPTSQADADLNRRR